MRSSTGMINNLLNLLFPRRCINCGTLQEQWICNSCMGKIKVHVGYETIGNGYKCACLTAYDEIIKKGLRHLKFHNRKSLSNQLGSWMEDVMMSTRIEISRPDYILAAPLHWRRHWQRGYNHSELLCHNLTETWRVPVRTDILRRWKNTAHLYELGRAERAEIMKDAFVCLKPGEVTGKKILLFDDIFTTGNTLASMTRVLEPFHPQRVECLCLARA